MHEIVIPMVPSRNILSGTGWWRNSHNDRVVWRQRVAEAVRDVPRDESYVVQVECDWQARPKPVTNWDLIIGIRRELVEALGEAGLRGRVQDVCIEQTGRGAKGETRLYLERD